MHEAVIRRVLVASDSLDGMAGALTKATRLTREIDEAAVRALVTSHEPIADEPAEVLPGPQRTALVDALVRETRRRLDALVDGAGVEASVLWTPEAAGEITGTAAQWPADLLVKPVSPHHPVADYLHTPLDWALMRDSPCPVLVSKGDVWPAPSPVLAAIDAGDSGHAALCREILVQAAGLARILAAELHVVTSYPDLGQTVNELQVATDFDGIKADMRASRERTLSAMLNELELAATDMHLLEGRPEQVIPDLARRLHPAVTVLGTAARRGMAKLLFGNTAESLISRLPGDLMTVREPWS